MLNRYTTNAVGVTPFYDVYGSSYDRKMLQFGESLLYIIPNTSSSQINRLPKLAPRWSVGVFLGKCEHSDSFLVLTPNIRGSGPNVGVVKTKSVRRLVPSLQFSCIGLL